MNHECLDQGSSRRRLAECLNHPRWNVWRDSFNGNWVASAPVEAGAIWEAGGDRLFTEQPPAIQYATERARAERLAAVQSAEGVTAR